MSPTHLLLINASTVLLAASCVLLAWQQIRLFKRVKRAEALAEEAIDHSVTANERLTDIAQNIRRFTR